MPKTLSILDNESWKENYGKLLELLAEHQNIRGTEIGRAIHRLGDATGRERLGIGLASRAASVSRRSCYWERLQLRSTFPITSFA